MREPYAVTALQYGSVTLPKRELFHRFELHGEPSEAYEMAYFVWVVVGDDGDVLVVDTGFDPEVGRRRGRTCAAAPPDALQALGHDPNTVETVVLTHLHYDHTGNVTAFPNAQLVVPQAELDFWTGPLASRPQLAAHIEQAEVSAIADRVAARGGIVTTGRYELAPGLELRPVGGHSPGQQLVVLEDERGTVVLTSDAVHFYEELERDRPFAIFTDLAAMYSAYDTVSALAAGGAEVVPGHDPEVSRRYAPVFVDGDVVAVDVRARQRPS